MKKISQQDEQDKAPSWPLHCNRTVTREDYWYFFGTLVFIILMSFALGYWFYLSYKYVSLNTLFGVLSLYICGYVTVLVPAIWFFESKSYGWVFLIYVECLLLVLLLISVKEQVLVNYVTISEKKPLLSLFVAYVMAAGCEESIKLIVYVVPLCVVKDLRTVYDLVFLSIVAGCSFGTIENLLLGSQGVTVALGRFFWCTVTHTSDCAVGALILGYVQLGVCSKYLYPLVLIVPIMLHGTYDYLLFIARDLKMEWLGYLSIVIGLLSVFLFLSLMFPLRTKMQQPTLV